MLNKAMTRHKDIIREILDIFFHLKMVIPSNMILASINVVATASFSPLSIQHRNIRIVATMNHVGVSFLQSGLLSFVFLSRDFSDFIL